MEIRGNNAWIAENTAVARVVNLEVGHLYSRPIYFMSRTCEADWENRASIPRAFRTIDMPGILHWDIQS